MDTYYYVATFEADNPEEADEIANGRDLDPPTELPTVDEIRARIDTAVKRLAVDLLITTGRDAELIDAGVARILEIVTLGGVPAS